MISQTDFAKINQKLLKNKHQEEINLGFIFKEFSCVELFIGAKYDVFDSNGHKTHTIVKRPINIAQCNTLFNILEEFKKEEIRQTKKK